MTIVKAITFILLHLFEEELIKIFFCLLLFNNPNTLIIKWIILDKVHLKEESIFWKPLNVNLVIGYVTATFVNNKASAFLTSPHSILLTSLLIIKIYKSFNIISREENF